MDPFCNLFVGCETGILKGIDVAQQKWVNLMTVEKADRQNEIVQMCWNDDDHTELCTARRDQNVSVFDTDSHSLVSTLHLASGSGPFKGLCKADSHYVTCTESGCLRVWSSSGQQKLEISVGDKICCMRNNPQQRHLVATGGNENTVKLWNLDCPESPTFAAKNVRHDWLNLRVPEWYTDIGFLPDSQRVVTCTNNHEVRVYDPLSSVRRPVLSVSHGDCPMTALSLQPDHPLRVFVGNVHGDVALVDLRNTGSVVRLYKGAEGSIRSISCHPSEPIMAACGLDRFVRVYDIESRELLQKFYLKSRLNCLLFSKRSRPQPSDAEVSLADLSATALPENFVECSAEDGDDSLWSSMQSVTSKSQLTKRRKRQSPDATQKTKSSKTSKSVKATKKMRR